MNKRLLAGFGLAVTILSGGFYVNSQKFKANSGGDLQVGVNIEHETTAGASYKESPLNDSHPVDDRAVIVASDTNGGDVHLDASINISPAVEHSPAQAKDVGQLPHTTELKQAGNSADLSGSVAEETDYLAEQIQLLDIEFAAEQYDAQWAPAVEEEVWRNFERHQLNDSQLSSVQCRTSLCRIEVTHEDETAEGEFMQVLLTQTLQNSGSIHRLASDESVATLIYLSR